MRRILAWVALCTFGPLLAGAAPRVFLAQQAQSQTQDAVTYNSGRLGVQVADLSERSIKALGLKHAHAILVLLPFSDGPAERAGLRPGDVIVELDGTGVGTRDAAIQRLGAGRAITLGTLRGSERLTIPATLGRLLDALTTAPPTDEERIAAYESILRLLDQTTFAQDWAAVQNQLGVTYQRRILGDLSDNQEKAIAAFEAALTIRTREALPREWAETQTNLGDAYKLRRRGDRDDNLDKVIAAYEAALTVTTRATQPREWAAIQNGIAVAYLSRIRGDKADNVERGIAAFEASLAIRTREALPREWAKTQHDLGIAYGYRIRGDLSDNQEKAVAAIEASLTVMTREEVPREWASAQSALGLAYLRRIRGDRTDNRERAIAALEAALTVTTTHQEAAYYWATTLSGLGAAYNARSLGDHAENQEKAIAAFDAALTVLSREKEPYDWAATQHNLGIAYQKRIRGDQANNREKAIAAIEAALTVRTRETVPRDWALTQLSLGNTYRERIDGERADNLEKSIAAYEAAFTIVTREALPHYQLDTGVALGGALSSAGKWHKAGLAYATARDAFLQMFGQGIDEADARNLIARAGPLFAEAAFAAAQTGDSERALALATEGRARIMAVALKLQTLDLPADKHGRLEDLRAEIRGADRTAEATQGTERAAAVEKLAGLRQELLGLVKAADAGGRAGHTSALTEARALAGKAGAVVVPIVTRFGAKILVVRGSDPQGLTPVDLPELTTQKLDALMRGDGKSGGWLAAYNINYIEDEDERARRWPEWIAAVGGLGPELWRLVGGRLAAALKEAGVKPGARIVWMPTGALGILPLGLAQDPGSGRRLADRYEIVYAPSLEALAEARERIAKAAPRATLGLIVNPTGDLPGTEKEGRLVASYFPAAARTVKERGQASPEAVLAALKGRSYWHFASHGMFSWEDARKSGLYLSGPKVLTVGRLLETDGLGRPRLVVLSACETGLYDIRSNPDEFIGLPGTFTALGAAGVLGTLWPVDDAATALLIARFYELHLGEGLAPPTALRRAQAWLREATSAELATYARGAAKQGRLETRHLLELAAELSEDGLRRSRNAPVIQWEVPQATRTRGKKATGGAGRIGRPYAHPYFWAGFIYTGL